MNQLENKVAIVTGATSGIGRASALVLAREGAKVVVAGRRASQGEEVVAEIKAKGGEALFIQTDVTDPAQAQALVDRSVEAYGGLDILFNNAGWEGVFGDFLHDARREDVEKVFQINVLGAFYVHQPAARAIIAAGRGGSIIYTSSVLGHEGQAGAAPYAAAKHAVEAFVKSAASELAPHRIRVNAVAPGPIRTEMADRAFGDRLDAFAESIPLGRVGTAEEVAEAVLFLAGPNAGFITGTSLLIDGGLLAK